jgi:hypothetical protein
MILQAVIIGLMNTKGSNIEAMVATTILLVKLCVGVDLPSLSVPLIT